MGAAKRLMEEQDAQRGDVLRRLKAAGAVSRCENHGYLIDNEDVGAQDDVRQELLGEGVSEDEADEMISDALAQVGEECPGCAKNAAD